MGSDALDIHKDNPAEKLNYRKLSSMKLGMESLANTRLESQLGIRLSPREPGSAIRRASPYGSPPSSKTSSSRRGDQFVVTPNSSFADSNCIGKATPPRLSFQAHSAPIAASFDTGARKPVRQLPRLLEPAAGDGLQAGRGAVQERRQRPVRARRLGRQHEGLQRHPLGLGPRLVHGADPADQQLLAHGRSGLGTPLERDCLCRATTMPRGRYLFCPRARKQRACVPQTRLSESCHRGAEVFAYLFPVYPISLVPRTPGRRIIVSTPPRDSRLHNTTALVLATRVSTLDSMHGVAVGPLPVGKSLHSSLALYYYHIR